MKRTISIRGLLTLCAIISFAFTSIAQKKTQTNQKKNEQSIVLSAVQAVPGNGREKLIALEAEYRAKYATLKNEAKSFALLHNIPMKLILDDGGFAELQRIADDGTPIYYRTFNSAASASTRADFLNTGGGLGLDLNGDNFIAHVWDGGHARVTHQDYDGPGGTNRVTLMDTAAEGGTQLNFHAAHVTGTICAEGLGSFAPPFGTSKGMAWQADVRGYMWNDDVAEATSQAGDGSGSGSFNNGYDMLVSNHSYGYGASGIPDDWFGQYGSDAVAWDNLMYNAPYYLMIVAAGNDGADGTSNAAPLGGDNLYDKLSGHATAKNNLVIANGEDAVINVDGSLNSVFRNEGSSEGPTDDFRIKPDMMGNGTSLASTGESADNDYIALTGTSMASPNVTGSLLLLQEHYHDLNAVPMRSATLKGLALHTADDVTYAANPPSIPVNVPVGPDAQTGWGQMNAKFAAETISADDAGTAIIDERSLNNGASYQVTLQADGGGVPLMVSISWTDPAGTLNGGTNSATPALVNDLDVELSNGATFSPWMLTGLNTNGTGDNTVDPFERIDIAGASGQYTLTVDHKGALASAQDYTIIVTGGSLAPLTPEISFTSTSGNFNEDTNCSSTVIDVPLNIGIAPSADATVNFQVNLASTATGGGLDFTLLTSSVIFPGGSTADQNMQLEVFHDGYIDPSETIIVDFTVTTGGDATANLAADTFTLTINDDDNAPVGSSTSTLYSEDFEDITGWTNIDNDGDGEFWLFITGLDGVGDFVGRGIGSVSNDAAVGGPGTLFDPDNYLLSEQITIPSNTTNTAFTYSVYGASSALEFYTLRWTTDISSIAAIDAGQLIEERFATVNTADTRTVNVNNIEGQTGYFVMIHNNPVASTTSHGLLVIDTLSIDVTVDAPVQTADNSGAPDQIDLPTSGTIYSSDPTSSDVMADIVNNNADDYGCVDIAVSRAGTGAQSYNGSALPDLVMDKTFDMSHSTAVGGGSTAVTFYFEETEVAGWETGVLGTVGVTRNTLVAGRGNASSITETSALTIGAFGPHVTLTGNFTDLDGTFYFGTAGAFVPACSGITKTWDGTDWIPTGAPTINDTVVIAGTYDTTTDGNIEACTITINTGETLTVNAASYIRSDGNISVLGTGSLIVDHEGIVVQVDPIASVTKSPTATINVDLTTPILSNRDFMVMGSPMDAELRTGVFTSAFLVLNSTPANFMPHAGVPMGGTNFADDKLINGKFWDAYSGAITVGEGFIVRPQTGYTDPAVTSYNMTYELGTLNNGDVSRPIGFNGLVDNPTGTPNILANPYASPISATALINDNALINELYFWEHLTPPSAAIPGSNNMNFSMDDISIYNNSMPLPAVNDPGASTTPNGVISTGQGFAIKAQAMGTVNFTNSMRLTSGNNTLRNAEAEASIDRLMLEVRNADYGVGSYTGVAFNPIATAELDPGYDTNRLATVVSLFSHLQDGTEQLAIQTMPEFDSSMKIPFGFTTQVASDLEYVISIASIEGNQISNANVFIADNLLGTITNLNESDYTFRSNKATYGERFTVLFETEDILGTQDNLAQTIGMYPNPAQDTFYIVSQRALINEILLHDISGRKVSVQTFDSKKTVQVDVSNLDAAIYFVTISTVEGNITKRLIKE